MCNLLWLTETQMPRSQPFYSKNYVCSYVDDLRMLIGTIFN